MDKKALLQKLNDPVHAFSQAELDAIIHDEFFNDAQPMDSDIVDAALTRRMQLNGIAFDELSVQKERERMIYDVLKEIFKQHK